MRLFAIMLLVWRATALNVGPILRSARSLHVKATSQGLRSSFVRRMPQPQSTHLLMSSSTNEAVKPKVHEQLHNAFTVTALCIYLNMLSCLLSSCLQGADVQSTSQATTAADSSATIIMTPQGAQPDQLFGDYAVGFTTYRALVICMHVDVNLALNVASALPSCYALRRL
jgi:hypothetical protein